MSPTIRYGGVVSKDGFDPIHFQRGHGSPSGYLHGCRDDCCVDAWRESQRARGKTVEPPSLRIPDVSWHEQAGCRPANRPAHMTPAAWTGMWFSDPYDVSYAVSWAGQIGSSMRITSPG